MSRAEKQPILYQEKLKLPDEMFRFATPKEVALYRAERLGCNIIVDIGAGIGGQTFAFAKKCKKVIAVEIDKKFAGTLINNLKKLRIENVKVIIGDALNSSIIEQIKAQSPDIIFCDTERKPEGERYLKDLHPDVKELLKKYSPITKNIAVEIPPFTQDIDTQLKKENYEKEFLSLNNKLNRLTLYFNDLKRGDKSVVSLPEKERIEKNEKDKMKKMKKVTSAIGFGYLCDINPAIVLAEMIEELALKINCDCDIIIINTKPYFISNQLISSSFLHPYKILAVTDSSQESISENLKKHNAGKVVLRFQVKPEEYWKIRNFYEKDLDKSGKEVQLFIDERAKEAIICERI